MHKLGNTIHKHIPANGRVAKTLTIIYAVWFYVIVTIAMNVYNPSDKHQSVSLKNTDIILGISILSWCIPAFISTLQDGDYAVFVLGGGKRQRKAYMDKLDERQLQSRQRIFEKSYTLLTTLILLATFIDSDLLDIRRNGVFLIGFNIVMLTISLPTLVATWDKKLP